MKTLILFLCIFPVYADYICEVHESDSQCAVRYGQLNVLLVTDYFSGKFGGSAVRISDKLVITAYHVTDTMMPLFNGMEPKWIDSNEDWDLDLYRVEGMPESEYAVIGPEPTPGTKVYALGYPGGIAYTITSGYWLGSHQEGEEHAGYHSAPIHPGSSGGALVYIHHGKFREVRLLGLTNWGAVYDDKWTTMGWVTKSEYILKFLEKINDQADR